MTFNTRIEIQNTTKDTYLLQYKTVDNYSYKELTTMQNQNTLNETLQQWSITLKHY